MVIKEGDRKKEFDAGYGTKLGEGKFPAARKLRSEETGSANQQASQLTKQG